MILERSESVGQSMCFHFFLGGGWVGRHPDPTMVVLLEEHMTHVCHAHDLKQRYMKEVTDMEVECFTASPPVCGRV